MRLHDMPRTALVCGALLILVGGALVLRPYLGLGQGGREVAGVATGPDTVGLIGTLLAVEGLFLVLAGLFVLRTSPSPVAAHPRSSDASVAAVAAIAAAEGPTGELDVTSAQVVTIGGGLGSFALVDRLRMAGVGPSDLVVVSTSAEPTARFSELCRSAGLCQSDRLRSDSAARMDNIWGFPGYAATEARRRRNPMPVLQTVLDPVVQPYTPTVGLLVDGVKREAERVGWKGMVTTGMAYRVTELSGGGYLVLVRREGRRDLAIQSRWVHLALGYLLVRSSGIDATGLDTTAEHHELVRALVDEGLGELNELGCLRVDDDFCVSRSVSGGILASGMTATGAPLAPMDSFLGLQSAALSISHTLAESGVGQPLTPLRSLRSWWHWMKGTSL